MVNGEFRDGTSYDNSNYVPLTVERITNESMDRNIERLEDIDLNGLDPAQIPVDFFDRLDPWVLVLPRADSIGMAVRSGYKREVPVKEGIRSGLILNYAVPMVPADITFASSESRVQEWQRRLSAFTEQLAVKYSIENGRPVLSLCSGRIPQYMIDDLKIALREKSG